MGILFASLAQIPSTEVAASRDMLMFKDFETKCQIILDCRNLPFHHTMNFYLFVHSTQYGFDLSELK